jgi:hypothetical protein
MIKEDGIWFSADVAQFILLERRLLALWRRRLRFPPMSADRAERPISYSASSSPCAA